MQLFGGVLRTDHPYLVTISYISSRTYIMMSDESRAHSLPSTVTTMLYWTWKSWSPSIRTKVHTVWRASSGSALLIIDSRLLSAWKINEGKVVVSTLFWKLLIIEGAIREQWMGIIIMIRRGKREVLINFNIYMILFIVIIAIIIIIIIIIITIIWYKRYKLCMVSSNG